jgi:predicted ATP-grasp superfamily ATP-dependent carboligase
MKIVVTNAKNRIAYNVLRSLSAKGLEVYCADFVPRAMSFYSKYSAGHFIYPSPFRDQEQFVECLIAKIKQLKIDVLIPVFEELFLIAKHKEEISKHVRMAIPDYSQILVAHNKDQWEPIAGQLKIPVPKTFTIEKYISDPKLIEDLSFPFLIKPKQGGGGWGIKQINSASEFREILLKGIYQNLPLGRFFIQEKIEGDVFCVAMVYCRGSLKGQVTYKQVREYPAFGGQATCRISCAKKDAEAYFQRFLEHLDWHGVCQADFVVDRATNIPFLIDINPRFWGSLAQGIASGVDFPYLIYQIALNGDVKPVEGFREGVVTRWLGGELRGFYQHYLRAKKKWPFSHDFFFPENSAALLDDFSFRDPFPFLAWGLDSLYRVVKFKGLRPHESLEGTWS